jgi:hypothetical protein
MWRSNGICPAFGSCWSFCGRALFWHGDRQLAAKYAEECQGDILPLTDRKGNFNNRIFTVMYEREGDRRLFSKVILKFLFFTERTKRSGVSLSYRSNSCVC